MVCPEDPYSPVGEPPGSCGCADGYVAFFCGDDTCDGVEGEITCEPEHRLDAFKNTQCWECSIYFEDSAIAFTCTPGVG